MTLKTLQKKYDELLKVFEEVGVTLNESQKNTLDTFMLDFQNKLNETRDAAIKTTKKLVEEKLESEFKEVFESIKTHQKEIFEKSSKIDLLKSQKTLVEALELYLSKYVEEVLPKKTIVDYGRMQKLEQIHESLKGMLLVNDEAVEKKVADVKTELEAKMVKENNELKNRLDESEKKMKDSSGKYDELLGKYGKLLKESLINEKTKNLPIAESKKVRSRLEKMTVEEIKKDYKTVLESVQEEIKDEQDKAQEEKNLEEAIADIMEGEKAAEKTGNDEDKGTESGSEGEEETKTDDETTEEVEGGVQVTESMMQSWIDTLARITPKH